MRPLRRPFRASFACETSPTSAIFRKSTLFVCAPVAHAFNHLRVYRLFLFVALAVPLAVYQWTVRPARNITTSAPMTSVPTIITAASTFLFHTSMSRDTSLLSCLCKVSAMSDNIKFFFGLSFVRFFLWLILVHARVFSPLSSQFCELGLWYCSRLLV